MITGNGRERRADVAGDATLVGRVGVLTISTRGDEGPGEVQVVVRGGEETYFAWSSDPLPHGQAVLIVDARPGANLDVVPWLDPSAAPAETL